MTFSCFKQALLCLGLVMVMTLGAVCLPPQAVYADDDQSLTVDLVQDYVDITLGFNGAHLALFGVKKDEDAVVAIVIRGPNHRMTVRRRDQVMGIWLNRQSVKFNDVPVYYDFAIGLPETMLASAAARKEYGIGLDALHFEPREKRDETTTLKFREALIRNKQIQGHFPLEPKKVTYLSPMFFRADFYVPPDVPTGDYVIETFLFKNQSLVDRKLTQLRVAQAGFNYRLSLFAYDHGMAYGLAAVIFALLSGWGAFALMRK